MLKSHFNILRDDTEPNAEEEHQEEAEVVVQEETDIPDRHLNRSEVSVRLSMLGKTAEGDGYTYLKATLTGLKLTHIDAIKSFSNLMFLDVSDNFLDLNALQAIAQLPFLILIQADNNRLNSAALKQMKYLQVIIMNNNSITSVHDIFQEEMSTIELGNNKLEKIAFDDTMKTLKVLDFRNNKISEITRYNFPNLDSLYLAGNKVTSLVGIEVLVNLRILHMRNNPIKILNGFDEALVKLQYINFRNCRIATLKQIKKLKVLKGLQTLILKGCPYMGGTGDEDTDQPDEEDPELRIEVLAALPRLNRINKEPVTSEEREEAKDLMVQWLEDGEKDEEEEVDEEQHHEEETNVED